jgi:hypothetical protein
MKEVEMAQAKDENMIAALKRERAVYVGRGDDDRVRQVDEQLKHYGCEDAQDAVPGVEEAPKGRTATGGKQTAEGDKAAATGGAKKSA